MDTTGGAGSEPTGSARPSPGEPRPQGAAAGPQPGDGPDRGPRPHPTWRDVGWASLSLGIAGVTAVQLVALVGRLGQADTTSGGSVLGFLIVVVWLLTISWLVMGSWRRSVWGCPFRHAADAPGDWRCLRHGVVLDGRHDRL